MRTFVAFLAAPLVVTIGWLASVYFSAEWNTTSHMPLSERLLELLVFGVAIYGGAATFTAIFAAPVFLVLRRFDLVRGWTSGLVGIVIGGLAGVLLGDFAVPPGILGLSLLGGIGGLVFWRVSRFDGGDSLNDV